MQFRPTPSLLVALCAFAGVPAQAQDAVTVYGRLNVSLENVDARHAPVDRSATRESNNRSVLGFRGTENLGDGYQAVWQIEGSLALDTGAGNSFANRDTRIGLSTPYGLVFAGHWGTPYLLSTSSFDPWYPTTAGYMALMGNGSAPTTDNISNRASFDRRQQNVIQYWSPTWNNITGRVAYSFNEGQTGPGGGSPRLWSASLTYDDGPWNLALAHEQHSDYQGSHLNDTATKIGAAYRFGDWRVAAAAERLRYETPIGALKRDSVYVSATWQIGAGSVRVGFTQAGEGKGPAGANVGFITGGSDTGARQWTLGYDYTLSKRTGLYAYVSRIDNQARAAYDFAINGVGVGAGEKPRVVAVGMRHAF